MIGLRKYYQKKLELSRDEIISKISDSPEFKMERRYPSYGEQHYLKANTNRIMIRIKSDSLLQFSENSGLGGIFEIMGHSHLEVLSETQTNLKLEFTMGIFPIILPYIFNILACLLFVIVFSRSQNENVTIILFLVILISSLFFTISSLFRVKVILDSFSKALDQTKIWE